MTWTAKGKPLTVDENVSIADADPEPTDAQLQHAIDNERQMSPELRAKLDAIDRQIDDIEAKAQAALEAKGPQRVPRTEAELSLSERRKLRAKQAKIDRQLRDLLGI